VILFKDSSANKGKSPSVSKIHQLNCIQVGVTSSSLEVLVGLALSTQGYLDHMIFKDGKPSAFYQDYVRDVQQKIKENAGRRISVHLA